MLDFIYTLFIAPLEYWMHAALAWAHARTGSWGESIIVMSLLVNFAILPIYMTAERWQEEERALRKGFEEKERMIKRVFSGQERFAMISTMHRQAGYSPFLALRSSVGFFLQIPFFFAAYHFLSHFAPLSGVSFLGLPDLARADGLIRLGSLSINVMPFVMTAINLASALVYTKNLTRKDKNQLYAMAAVFLVLLYDAASGLVLYWTCNNIFSFAKNVCYDLAHRVDLSGRLAAAAGRIRAATRPGPAPAGGARLIQAALALWAAGVALAILSSNQMVLLSESVKVPLSLASDALLLACAALSIVEIIRLRLWREHKLLLLVSAAMLWYVLSVWYRWEILGSNRRAFSLSAGLALLVITLALLNIRRPFARTLFPANPAASPAAVFTPAAAWLVILVTGYLPVETFATAPEVFSSPDVILAKTLLWSAALGVLLWAVRKLTLLWNSERLAGLWLGLIAFVLTAYAFLLPLDVGTIDAFQIANPAPLFSTCNLGLDLVVIALVAGLYLWCVRRGHARRIARVLAFASAAAVCAGVATLWQSQGTWQSNEGAEGAVEAKLPAWNDRFFGFSKNHPNTVIVMLDAFTGPHVPEILERAPDVAKSLRDFTWYSDAMAPGASTKTSIASILIGEGGTVGALNEGPVESLEDKINARYAETVTKLDPATDVALNERNWLEPVRLSRELAHAGWTGAEPLAVRYMGDSYLNRWVERTGAQIGRGDSDVFLLAVSLFKIVPWSGKNLIYKDGRWIETLMGNSSESLARRAQRARYLHTLLPVISNPDPRTPPLNFIDLEIKHRPWFMDLSECAIKLRPNRVVRPDGLEESHLACELCALRRLAEWTDWMRREGVYDNTNIVFVSDHSSGDAGKAGERLGGLYKALGRPDALLLFKPAGAPAREAMRADPSPVSISNVGEWLRGGSFGQPHPERLHWNAVPIGASYRILNVFRSTGSLFDPAAWEQIEGRRN